jgi:hypothetical protein
MRYRLGLISLLQIVRAIFAERVWRPALSLSLSALILSFHQLYSESGLILLRPIDSQSHPSITLLSLASALFFFSSFVGLLVGRSPSHHSLLMIAAFSFSLFRLSLCGRCWPQRSSPHRHHDDEHLRTHCSCNHLLWSS